MEVHIEIERTPESLNQRHRAGAGRRAGKACLFDQVRGNAAVHEAEHFAHDLRTTGKQASQRERQTQHSLAHRLCGKHLINQQCITLGSGSCIHAVVSHTTGTAAGTETAPLAARPHGHGR